MLISIAFSVVIYHFLSLEVDRFARMQRTRIEKRLEEGVLFPPEFRPRATILFTDPELMSEMKHRIAVALLTLNAGILTISGGFGYFLAGRTLKPIKDMVDEQNRFTSDASHELRTPLTSLKTAMEVFLRDKRSTLKESKTIIAESIQEVDKLQSLSDKLLLLAQFQKTEDGKRFTSFLFEESLNRALQRVRPLAKQKKITISQNASRTRIDGNKDLITDLLVIVLDNAIKYTPDGGTVTVQVEKPDHTVHVLVKDTGIGIDPKDMPHIFDRFYRADRARSRTITTGYGLGLSIAKKIVELHRGTIHVTSKPDVGTTIDVRLPTRQSDRKTIWQRRD
jgi:signal transduction histidine kinase